MDVINQDSIPVITKIRIKCQRFYLKLSLVYNSDRSKPTEFKVTVYDRRTLEPCYILDFTEHLPRGMGGEFCSITGVAITKSTLVIHFGHQIDVEEIKTLVYKERYLFA